MYDKTEKIWENFSYQLRKFILKHVSDQTIADDILQDVFVKIHSNIDGLKDESKIRGWIYQITRNALIDYSRKKKLILQNMETIEKSESRSIPGIDQDVDLGLEEMVHDLPEKYAQALIFTEFKGRTQKELAKELGLSVSAAKSRVQRGRALLRDSLMRCCHFKFDHYGAIIDYHPITCCCCQQYFENE
ncbi:MAG: RNA polymerase sigma factor SigZ [Caldithrix sp.]|nr:RNA polymerase sigma factor SigZ [Caldithrix sp.]